MNAKDFLYLGVPLGETTRRTAYFVSKCILGGEDKSRWHVEVAAIVANPVAFADDSLRSELTKAMTGLTTTGPKLTRSAIALRCSYATRGSLRRAPLYTMNLM